LSSATGDNPAHWDYRTWLLRRGDEVILNALLRHSRVKSYLKCSSALQTETVINDTVISAWRGDLVHLEEIFRKAHTTSVQHAGLN
jgi:hypothetical protein